MKLVSKKRYGSNNRRGKAPNRVDIECCPSVVIRNPISETRESVNPYVSWERCLMAFSLVRENGDDFYLSSMLEIQQRVNPD